MGGQIHEYPPEVKAEALALAALGKSVREIERTLSGQNKDGPRKTVIHEWIVESGQSAVWAQAQFAAAASTHAMIQDTAAAKLMQLLEGDVTAFEANAAYGTATDKLLALAKLGREANRDNLLRRALDVALDLPVAERRARLAAAGMPPPTFEGSQYDAPDDDAPGASE
jgi:hypothetical protein